MAKLRLVGRKVILSWKLSLSQLSFFFRPNHHFIALSLDRKSFHGALWSFLEHGKWIYTLGYHYKAKIWSKVVGKLGKRQLFFMIKSLWPLLKRFWALEAPPPDPIQSASPSEFPKMMMEHSIPKPNPRTVGFLYEMDRSVVNASLPNAFSGGGHVISGKPKPSFLKVVVHGWNPVDLTFVFWTGTKIREI